tara:strand:+ start:912 stop:1400 length:489 start_codon:yes stop_codon:yes gene_type:complete
MRNIFVFGTLVILSLILNSCASVQYQETPRPRIATYDNNLSQNANFVLANEWIVEAFNDAKSVIQFTDKESGIIKGKYLLKDGNISTSPYGASTEPFYAIITLRVRDQKCRIEIDPPSNRFYSYNSMGEERGFTTDMFEEQTNLLINDFRNRMLESSQKSDW